MGILALPALARSVAFAQDEDFRIYKDPPRLFLNQQRLRRLQRETTRDSLRWRQFSALAEGKAQFPEPGFAWALHYAASGNAGSAAAAVEWAMQPASQDLRQLALVYDWCLKILTPEQKSAIGAKLKAALTAASAGATADQLRDQTLAAVTIAEAAPAESEKFLKDLVTRWWRKEIAPGLNTGKPALRREELTALFEIMHVLQDNLKIDLREDAPKFFKSLPAWHMLSHYPAPLQTPENEFRVPVFTTNGEPDLRLAALSRAAELMMVAYDVNATESQFLQGFLIQDRFLMRAPFGITYEFLWANPYQPGLPFEKMEPFFHDAVGGRFFVRSSWEEDSAWFGFFDGTMQSFSNGEIKVLQPASFNKPIVFGNVIIMQGREDMKLDVNAEDGAHYFILGLGANNSYDVEVDDEEMYEAVADASGILSLSFPNGTKARAWVHKPGRGL